MAAPTKTQLIGGVFQDSEGNVLNLGYLIFRLSSDETVVGVGEIAAGITVKINLNSAGSVSTSPPQYIWANDVMTPANNYYIVEGFTAAGQLAWGPNNQQVTSGGVGGGTFDVGTWIPNTVLSWFFPAAFGPTGPTGPTGPAGSTGPTGSGGTGPTGPAGSGQVGPRPSFGNWRGWATSGNIGLNVVGSGVPQTSYACTPVSQANGALDILPTATETVLWKLSTGASSSGVFAMTNNMVQSVTLGLLKKIQFRVKLDQLTNTRVWLGLFMIGPSGDNALLADTILSPFGFVVAFRYSAGTDTTWQAYTNASGTVISPVVTDTLIAPETTVSHLFEIGFDGVNVLFFIDSVQVASVATGLPPTSQGLGSIQHLDNQGSSANVAFELAYGYEEILP
jgi:hypothetical protein